jgi:DNA repair exonuclease SbcCD nuclease subunit
MRVLLFTDLHAHAFSKCSTTLPSGRNSRLQDAVDVCDEIYKVCKQASIDGVLFLGDLFHVRGTLKVATLNAAYESFAKIKTAVDWMGILVGNHDQATKLGDEHAVYAFRAIATVMDEPRIYQFGQDNTLSVFALPYSEDVDGMRENLEKNRDVEVDACIGHVCISGARPGANFVLKSPNMLTAIDFRGYPKTFLGHYHMKQDITDNIHYLGSPLQHNWGDVGQQRGYWIWDTNTNGLKFFESDAPKFVLATERPGEYVEVSDPAEGNFVRVVSQAVISPPRWQEIKTSFLQDLKAKHVEAYVEPTAPTTLDTADQGDYHPSLSFEHMVESFARKNAPKGLNVDELIRIGKEALLG